MNAEESRKNGKGKKRTSVLSVILAVLLSLQTPLSFSAYAQTPGALHETEVLGTESAESGSGAEKLGEDSNDMQASPSDSTAETGEASPSDSETDQASKASPSDGGLYDEDGFLIDGDVIDDVGAGRMQTASDAGAGELSGDEMDVEIDAASASEADELLPDAVIPGNMTYPAQNFSGSAGGIHVEAAADEGVFPDGTNMIVTAISKQEALRAAKEAADEEKEIRDAAGVDISFRDSSGAEIEPNGEVSVSLSLEQRIEGEEFSVVHKDDDGTVETVTENADAAGADFTSDKFSIYIISGVSEPPIATYVFHDAAGEELSTQKVKNGEILYAPASPEQAGAVFRGWAESAGASSGELFETKTVSGLTESTTIHYYPAFVELHYVYFMDSDGNIAVTQEGIKGTSIDLSSVSIPLANGEAVEGWYYDESLTNPVGNSLEIGDADISLYPKVESGHWLKFDTDGGNKIDPQFVAANANPVQPEDPEKQGYTFVRWTNESGETFDFSGPLTVDTTIKAIWTNAEYTNYTVIYWQQSLEDSWEADDAAKTYEFYTSEKIDGVRTGITVSADDYSSKHLEDGFEYNSSNSTASTTVLGDGSTVVNVCYDRKIMTVTFQNVPTQQIRYQKTGSSFGDNSLPSWSGHDYLRYISETQAETVHCDEIYEHYHDDVAEAYTAAVKLTYTFKGLYGAKFDWDGSAPDKRDENGNVYSWYCREKNTHYYFLDTFVFGNPALTSITLTRDGAPSGDSLTEVRVYLQQVDGSYSDDPYYVSAATRNRVWIFSETFDGFTVDSYQRTIIDGTGDWTSQWTTVSAGGRTKLDNTSVLSIRYRRNTYSVAFQNGNENYANASLNYEESLEELREQVADPTSHDGSISEFFTEFGGWYLDQAFTQPLDYDSTMPSHNVIVYAKWTRKTHAVTAHTDAGDKVIKVESGERISKKDMPLVKRGDDTFGGGTDTDYQIDLADTERFICWATKDGSGVYHAFSFDVQITEDTDLYPYVIGTDSYHVIYDLNGGSGTAPYDSSWYAEGAAARAMSASGITGPETTPYFQYWIVDGSGASYYPGDAVMIPDHDVTLKAVYGEVPKTVTLTYHMSAPGDTSVQHVYQNAEGRTDLSNNESTTICGIDAAELTSAGFRVPEGYVFCGWTTMEGGSSVEYTAGQNVGVDSLPEMENHLYAVFAKEVTLKTIGQEENNDGSSNDNNGSGSSNGGGSNDGGSNGGNSNDGGSSGSDGGNYIGGHAHEWDVDPAAAPVLTGSDTGIVIQPEYPENAKSGKTETQALPKTGEESDGRFFRFLMLFCAAVLALFGIRKTFLLTK